MNVSAILRACNGHANGKKIYPKFEVYLITCIENWNKNKRIEACSYTADIGIDHLYALFKFGTPSQTVHAVQKIKSAIRTTQIYADMFYKMSNCHIQMS